MFSIPFPPDIRLRLYFRLGQRYGTSYSYNLWNRFRGNGFAVLTNPENGDKKSLRCNAIVAKVSIVDPDCMKTMPKHVLAAVGFDALCHCMEAYTSKISQL